MRRDQYTTVAPKSQVAEKKSLLQKTEGLRVAEASVEDLPKSLILNGGQRRDRTADAGLFRAALYH